MKKLGIGHRSKIKNKKTQQGSFFKINWNHRFTHGGVLRNKRLGRGARPLSTKESLHLVFKVNKEKLRHQSLRQAICFTLINQIIKKYAKRFNVKIEQISIQNDHIHALIRTARRSEYLYFFRVVAGQIAQCFEKEGLLKSFKLWKFRPFTRVIKGWKAYKTVKDYIQLNELEVLGKIRYQKRRLKGLSSVDWKTLWL